MGSSHKQHRSTHIPSHLQEKPSHAGFMGSSKACRSPCLTLQSRWCSISQTAGAGSILSLHRHTSACCTLPGKSRFPQPGEKHSKVVAGPGWQGCCSTFFFPTGQHTSYPQPITHFIDATATRRHQLISRSGRQSNSPGFRSHSHYAGQGNPAASRPQDQARPTKPGSDGQAHPQKGLCCPRCCPAFQSWLAKQLGIAASSRERQPQTRHTTVPW